ncbi:Mrna Decay Activator Protein Zfp36L1 [Manis pentadactyla]|nr:Mrna Decay Activator Protein Zfp36L1 [Manis pentadactyla]
MPVQQDTGLSGCSLLQPCIGRAMRQGLSEGTHSVEMVSKHPEAQSSRCATAVSVASFGPCWAYCHFAPMLTTEESAKSVRAHAGRSHSFPPELTLLSRPVCPGSCPPIQPRPPGPAAVPPQL